MTAILILALVLVTASIFVNGWTDAPNAIATVVSTKVMPPRVAVIMASIFNFLGVVVMGTAVADAIGKLVDLSSFTPKVALLTIAAAQLSIVVWSTAAWFFGIPTSESHALIAGLTGAGIAVGGVGIVSMDKWIDVIKGLGISTVIGFGGGFIVVKIVVFIFRKVQRKKANNFFSIAQAMSGALMAFSHGAQDGQKFMGVLAITLVYAGKLSLNADGSLHIPFYLMVYCSVVMAIGTSIGGYKIIKTMGMDMVKLEKYQGFSAELSAAVIMLVSTKLGIPLSTTHTKTTAIMGVGVAKRLSALKLSIVQEMILAWVLTFPFCGLFAYLVVKLFLYIFN